MEEGARGRNLKEGGEEPHRAFISFGSSLPSLWFFPRTLNNFILLLLLNLYMQLNDPVEPLNDNLYKKTHKIIDFSGKCDIIIFIIYLERR